MTLAEGRARSHNAHPEEWLSILLCLATTAVATAFIGWWPNYGKDTPAGVAWAIPVWIGLLYLIVQLTFLLFSASQIRALGVLDSVLAILPVVAGLVIFMQMIIGSLPLSAYQKNTLAVLIVTGAAEFLLTIWIRFVVNRRTVAFGGDN